MCSVDDANEPNDNKAQATTVPLELGESVTLAGQIVCRGSPDVFRVPAIAGGARIRRDWLVSPHSREEYSLRPEIEVVPAVPGTNDSDVYVTVIFQSENELGADHRDQLTMNYEYNLTLYAEVDTGVWNYARDNDHQSRYPLVKDACDADAMEPNSNFVLASTLELTAGNRAGVTQGHFEHLSFCPSRYQLPDFYTVELCEGGWLDVSVVPAAAWDLDLVISLRATNNNTVVETHPGVSLSELGETLSVYNSHGEALRADIAVFTAQQGEALGQAVSYSMSAVRTCGSTPDRSTPAPRPPPGRLAYAGDGLGCKDDGSILGDLELLPDESGVLTSDKTVVACPSSLFWFDGHFNERAWRNGSTGTLTRSFNVDSVCAGGEVAIVLLSKDGVGQPKGDCFFGGPSAPSFPRDVYQENGNVAKYRFTVGEDDIGITCSFSLENFGNAPPQSAPVNVLVRVACDGQPLGEPPAPLTTPATAVATTTLEETTAAASTATATATPFACPVPDDHALAPCNFACSASAWASATPTCCSVLEAYCDGTLVPSPATDCSGVAEVQAKLTECDQRAPGAGNAVVELVIALVGVVQALFGDDELQAFADVLQALTGVLLEVARQNDGGGDRRRTLVGDTLDSVVLTVTADGLAEEDAESAAAALRSALASSDNVLDAVRRRPGVDAVPPGVTVEVVRAASTAGGCAASSDGSSDAGDSCFGLCAGGTAGVAVAALVLAFSLGWLCRARWGGGSHGGAKKAAVGPRPIAATVMNPAFEA